MTISADHLKSREFAEKVKNNAWNLSVKLDPQVRDVIAHSLHDPRIERIEYETPPAWRASGVTIVLGWRISGGLLPPGDPFLSVFGGKSVSAGDRLCQLLQERTRIMVFDEDSVSG